MCLQPVFQLIYANSGSETLQEAGFSVQPNTYIVLTSIVVALLSLRLIRTGRSVLFAALSASSLFSAAIYTVQKIEIGNPRYFYYKSTVTIFLVSAICVALACSHLYASNLAKKRSAYTISLIILVPLLLTTYNATNTSDYLYRYRHPKFNNNVIKKSFTSDMPLDNIMSIGACNREDDYVISKLAAILASKNNRHRQDLTQAILSPSKADLATAMEFYEQAETTNLTIYSQDSQLTQYMAQRLNGGPFLESYITESTASKNQLASACPHRVR